jgi:hypothetical protein
MKVISCGRLAMAVSPVVSEAGATFSGAGAAVKPATAAHARGCQPVPPR